jgi:nucleoside-diphosphate-sugar epimerase
VDLLFVEDAVLAVGNAARRQELYGHSCELGSGHAVEVEELARRIISLCGSSSPIERRPMRRGEPDRENAFRAASRADRNLLLSRRKLVSLEEGLQRTIKWYRRYGAIGAPA